MKNKQLTMEEKVKTMDGDTLVKELSKKLGPLFEKDTDLYYLFQEYIKRCTIL
jgi:hypothetical protein